MNAGRLQQLLDQLLATTAQRFALSFVALVSVVGASWAMALSTVRPDAFAVVLCAFLALVVIMEPDEQLGAVVIGLVILQWLGTSPDPTSSDALMLACALFVFHTTVALMAVTPHTSTIPVDVLVTWSMRSLAVMIPTGVVWVLVVVFERRGAPGSVVLSTLAVATLAAGVLAIGHRSGEGRPGDDHDRVVNQRPGAS